MAVGIDDPSPHSRLPVRAFLLVMVRLFTVSETLAHTALLRLRKCDRHSNVPAEICIERDFSYKPSLRTYVAISPWGARTVVLRMVATGDVTERNVQPRLCSMLANDTRLPRDSPLRGGALNRLARSVRHHFIIRCMYPSSLLMAEHQD